MTEITFHFNVHHHLDYSCRLLRKAFLKGASVVVTADATTLTELDNRLWSLTAHEFVPHCKLDVPQSTFDMTPIVLSESLDSVERDGVLINLGHQVPVAFQRFERLIEVVSADHPERLAARQRWKHYSSRGYVIKQYDLAINSEPT